MGDYDFSLYGDTPTSTIDARDFSLGELRGTESVNPGYTPDLSTRVSGDDAGGGGWGRVGDVASKLWSGLGDVAKAGAPLVGAGAGIMGLIAQRQAAQRIAQQQPVIDRAQKVQVANAEAAQPYAAEAAALSPKVEAVAPKLDAVASKIAAQTGQPVVDYATQLLAKVSAGEIPDAYKAQIENWRQAAKAKVLDYLARSGQADSSARIQLEAWVDQQAEAMAAGILGSEEKTALSAFDQGRGAYVSEAGVLGQEGAAYGNAAVPLGTAGSILTGSSGSAGAVATNARAEEQSLEELIANANKTLMRVAAGAA